MTRSQMRREREARRIEKALLILDCITLAILIVFLCVDLSYGSEIQPIELKTAAAVQSRQGVITVETEAAPAAMDEKTAADPEPEKVYLGVFNTTGYCNCRHCCGKWSGGPTASGAMPKAQHTVAVDPKVIPLGSKILMNGTVYVAEDTGSGVNGNHIDVYYDDHYTAACHGLQEADVWLLK